MAFPDTLPDMLARAERVWPDRPYLQNRQGEVIVARAFSQVAAEVRAIAGGLIRLGIGHGDRVAILGENRPEWVLHYLAIVSAAAVVVPLDSLMSPPEIAYILGRANARTLVVSLKYRDSISTVAAENSIRLLSMDSPDGSVPRVADPTLPAIRPSDVAVIMFTSGTTGFSKGVMLSHGNLCSDVDGVLQAVQIQPTDNFHLLLPLHHTYSSTVNMLVPLGGGARATFATSFKSRDIADDIRIASITLLVGVPQVYENILAGLYRAVSEAPGLRRALFRLLYLESLAWSRIGINLGPVLFRSLRKKAGMTSLRYLISGGAALRPETNRDFQRLGFELLQGYGLTETSPILCVNPPHKNRIGSVGPAIGGVELRIDSPDSGTGIGEICARGPNVMLGYYEDPEATAGVVRDGWFHTGDAGYLDRDGYLFLTGRVRSLIVTGAGKNVYPEAIEAQLNASPYLLESLVIGVARKRGTGEELYALLVPDRAAVESEKQRGREINVRAEFERLIEDYNSSAPAYRRIRQWQVREEEFEKTSTRKIKRYLYKDAFKEGGT